MADFKQIPSSDIQPQFDEIYSKVLKTIKTKNIQVSDLVIIATSAMTIVQKYPILTGTEKKTLVIDIIQKIINKTDLLPENQKQPASFFIEFTLPTLIDTIVSAYNHDIDLKKLGVGCLKCIFKRI
uniref:Uncharacterized protein n=1 Tax=Marseillevirus LCMAC102 TaxID=2506603 RepID=A0A481YSY9_9VIRU|nr:MAG: uncharacterized protein LCMAC102_01570 [Marseillevirus LCMAC102]